MDGHLSFSVAVCITDLDYMLHGSIKMLKKYRAFLAVYAVAIVCLFIGLYFSVQEKNLGVYILQTLALGLNMHGFLETLEEYKKELKNEL